MFLVSLVKIRLPSDLPEREQGRPQVAPLQGLGADCDFNLFEGLQRLQNPPGHLQGRDLCPRLSTFPTTDDFRDATGGN